MQLTGGEEKPPPAYVGADDAHKPHDPSGAIGGVDDQAAATTPCLPTHVCCCTGIAWILTPASFCRFPVHLYPVMMPDRLLQSMATCTQRRTCPLALQ